MVLSPSGQAQPSDLTITDAVDMIRLVLEFVKEHALVDVSVTTLLRGAFTGILEAVGDPYSGYFDPQAYEALMQRLDGKFSGVGLILTFRDGFVTVVSPILGTPAERAGFEPHDRIVNVDGVDVTGISTETVAGMLRGPETTSVTVTVQRPSTNETFVVTMRREMIDIPSISYQLVDGFGYIAITSFTEDTAAEFKDAFDSLVSEHEIDGLIIDLRYNGGGRVDQGIDIAELFVPEGPIAYLVNRQGERRVFRSETPAWGKPLVVIVNEGTASTAEILTIALQDWQVATVVGTGTFGKSTVQSIVGLGSHGGLRLTTAEYVSPIGRSLKDTGITPDKYVEQGIVEQHFSLTRVLMMGLAGDDVAGLQRALLEIGFAPGPVDGMFGQITASAVREFQRTWKLSVTGEVGPAEVEVLNQLLSDDDRQLSEAVTVLTELTRTIP